MKTMTVSRQTIHSGSLLLINDTHPLPDDYHVSLRRVAAQTYHISLETRTAVLLQNCINAVNGQGHIVPVSGWRSHQEQQDLWDRSIRENGEAFTRSYVALPGCSEHESGLAVDLAQTSPAIDTIRPHFPCDGVCGAFRRRAAQFGFILRYRGEKYELTHIAEEPWHFRYVGIPHAAIIEENHLSLEEYGAFLTDNPQQYAFSNGITAHVRRVQCDGEQTVMEIPRTCRQISGDNNGGLIMTCWR